MKKRVISLGLALMMLCSMMGVTAFAAPIEKKNELLAVNAFVMEQVEAFAAIDDAWNETTQIADCVTLYAPDDTINGYIFHFKTGGVDTGFMQIGILGQELFVVNLGFEGDDVLSKMVKHHNSVANSGLTAEADAIVVPVVSLDNSAKIYYTGGFNYYLNGGRNELVSLAENEVVETGISSLAAEYSAYQDGRAIALEEAVLAASEGENTRSSSSGNYTVEGYYTASLRMKTMSYWPNYNEHCSPTAATNMVMYWKYGRGFFANHAASTSQTSVFTWFYNKMKTNLYQTGTDWDDIWPAYAEYFTNNSGASTAISDRVTAVTFNKIRTKMDENIPVHLEVRSYDGGGNHSVNVWGYAVSDSANYLRITDNWGDTIGNILIGYSEYSYGQYVYYGLNA